MSRGDVVAWVEALRVGMGLAILAFPSLPPGLAVFPTAVFLSEADMEQSFSWPKVDM